MFPKTLASIACALLLACGVPPDGDADAGGEHQVCDGSGTWTFQRTWTGGDCEVTEADRNDSFTITLSSDNTYRMNSATPGVTVDGQIRDDNGDCKLSANITYDQSATDADGNVVRVTGAEALNLTESDGSITGSGDVQLTITINGAAVACSKQFTITGSKS
jgi:hypothetical protein